MTEEIISALNLYASFFIFLIAVCFASFIIILLILIRNIKNRKLLKENRTFISEIIQTQEKERSRISQELHDTISQNIKTLLLKEKELFDTCNDKKTSTELEKIISLEKQNQTELRSIIQNLNLPVLKSVPFKTVINDLCRKFSSQSGISCSFFVSRDVPLEKFSTEQKHHILRIIQEALNNAKNHANCSETSVVIRKENDKICIMIFDEGQGFDVNSRKNASETHRELHFGMSGMEMRSKLLGGTLNIKSDKKTGTEVRVEIPV